MGPAELLNIVLLSPLERLDRVVEIEPDAHAHVADMKRRYSWFLYKTGQPRSDVIEWISDPANRSEADSGRQASEIEKVNKWNKHNAIPRGVSYVEAIFYVGATPSGGT